jgi:hypothetical protein
MCRAQELADAWVNRENLKMLAATLKMCFTKRLRRFQEKAKDQLL